MLVVLAAAAAVAEPVLLKRGDQLFDQQAYQPALDRYRQASTLALFRPVETSRLGAREAAARTRLAEAQPPREVRAFQDLLSVAAQQLQDAQHVLTADRYPLEWARAQCDLGLIAFVRSERSKALSDTWTLLHQADDAYRLAFTRLNVKNAPEDAAKALNDRAAVLLRIAELEPDSADAVLAQAKACYETAAGVLEQWPKKWATVQFNIGAILDLQATRLFRAGNKTAAYRLVADEPPYFRRALEKLTPSDPDWPKAKADLAVAFRHQAGEAADAGDLPNAGALLLEADRQSKEAVDALTSQTELAAWMGANYDRGLILNDEIAVARARKQADAARNFAQQCEAVSERILERAAKQTPSWQRARDLLAQCRAVR